MGCKNSKSLSVLERYKQESESAGYEEPETTNPMSPPIRTSLRLSIPGSKDSKEKSERGGSGGDGGKSFAHRMSTFTERLRGSSVDKNQASDAASSGPQIKPPPSFLFTGRRFRKHHNSSFAEMTGMGQGRILKLVSSGEIVWYKTKRCEGVPERGEASEPDGSFKLEVVKHIQVRDDLPYTTTLALDTLVTSVSTLLAHTSCNPLLTPCVCNRFADGLPQQAVDKEPGVLLEHYSDAQDAQSRGGELGGGAAVEGGFVRSSEVRDAGERRPRRRH